MTKWEGLMPDLLKMIEAVNKGFHIKIRLMIQDSLWYYTLVKEKDSVTLFQLKLSLINLNVIKSNPHIYDN